MGAIKVITDPGLVWLDVLALLAWFCNLYCDWIQLQQIFIVVVNTSVKQNVIIMSFTLKLNFQKLIEKMASSQL